MNEIAPYLPYINMLLNLAAIPVVKMLWSLSVSITALEKSITAEISTFKLSVFRDFVTKQDMEDRFAIERMVFNSHYKSSESEKNNG